MQAMATLQTTCGTLPVALQCSSLKLRRNVRCRRDISVSAGKTKRSPGGSKGVGGSGRKYDRDSKSSSDVVSEDVEVFNINSGWNVEALTGAEADNILDTLDGWSVDAFELDDLSDDDDDDEGMDIIELNIDDIEDSDSEDEELDIVVSKEDSSKGKGGGKGTSQKMALRPSAGSGRAERDLLSSLPAHMVRRLEALQEEADAEASRLAPNTQRKAAARQKTHRRLRIVAGHAAGIRIFSPQGDQTRPMMEMVRGAVFNMIASLHNSPGGLPEGTRWLDLFAGTGAVGIEALSRGCSEAHFVELSPWVASNCLQPNLEKCSVEDDAVVHTTRAEDFLKRAAQIPRFAGGAFDFVSVCPPYEAVSYTELYDLLDASPLIHENSIVVVEYPKKAVHEIRDNIKSLVKLRDRKYGRTLVAIYGPESNED